MSPKKLAPIEQTVQKPRNFYLPERNELLVYRYYYYDRFMALKYDHCLQKLELEFFLTSVTISHILIECSVLLEQVANSQPTCKNLQAKFPHLNWPLK